MFGGSYIDNSVNELEPKKKDVAPIVYGKVEIEGEAAKKNQKTPPLTLLTDTGSDHYFENKKDAEIYHNEITKCFSKHAINATYEKTIVMPLFSEIHYKVADESQIDQILALKSEISKATSLKNFNILFKGDLIHFEFANKQPSKISMKFVLSSLKTIKPDQGVIGLNYENNPLTIDFISHGSSVIIGQKGSGASMLLSTLIASVAYTTSPDDLEIILLSLQADKALKSFESMPHIGKIIFNNFDKSVETLVDVKNEIILRQKEFAQIDAKSIDEYNQSVESQDKSYKRKLVIISGYDYLMRNNLQNVDLLQQIAAEGKTVGIYLLLLANNVNNETINEDLYKNLSAKFILKLQTEYESLRMFDTYRGSQLYGNGDGYYFDTLNNTKTRFQTCYLNQIELNQIIETIKTFYDAKNDQSK